MVMFILVLFKSKLQGFKNKAIKLEGLYSELSSSLQFSSSLKIVEKEKIYLNKSKR